MPRINLRLPEIFGPKLALKDAIFQNYQKKPPFSQITEMAKIIDFFDWWEGIFLME